MTQDIWKKRLLATTLIAGVAGAIWVGPAVAQEDEDAIIETNDAQQDEEEAVQQTVTVTGSRIRQPDYQFSNPVTSVNEESIEYSGTTNLTNFLQDLPALTNSFDSEDSAETGGSSAAGLNLLNLRNLGEQRTLVLVNGRRHVASDPGSSSVDVNTIPIGLIENVEVLTGGASAIYGADGVSGVVNFVLKDDFEGLDARAQFGQATEGGGEDGFISVLAGKNFFNDRLNLTAAFEYSTTKPVDRDDRDYAKFGNREILLSNPDDPGTFNPANDDPDILDNIFARGVTYIDTSPYGSIYTDGDFADSLAGVDFTGNGDPWTDGVFAGGFTAIGGDGTLLDGFVDQLLPGIDRYNFNTTANWEVVPGHNMFGEFKYVNAQTEFVAQPTFDYFLTVPIDNPYIPEAARADALGPNGLGAVYVGRDNFDLGNTGRDITRETYRGVIGFEGPINDNFDYEVSLVRGITETENIYKNDRISERWYAAIDAVEDPATGNIVCRSDLDPTAIPADQNPDTWGTTFNPGANSGCVPADIFGEDISPEARDWINQDTKQTSRITQTVLNGYVSGSSKGYFELPGGPVGAAVGFEYRKETSASKASQIELTSAAVGEDLTWAGQGSNTTGAYDVTEFFGEVDLPLLADMPFVKELTVDGAFRVSDYSTSGQSETWKIGGLWRPTDWLMFRATTAEAVRSPNISELFLPQTQTFEILSDPCTIVNLEDPDSAEVEALRLENCTADLGFNPNDTGFNPNVSSSTEGRVGGNPDLDVETANTDTYGIVVQPTFLEGLTLSLDYYDIELEDAIQFFEAQTIVNKCYDLPRPNQFCGLIQRDPTDGTLSYFQQFAVNVASYKTSGYDFSVRYRLDPQELGWTSADLGNFNISLVGTKLEELVFIELADAEPDEQAGLPGAPEWQAVFDITWNYKKLSLNYGFSYFDETERFAPQNIENDPDIVNPKYYNYSERFTHDIQARYQLTENYSIYGGVNNFTNQEPDRGSLDTPVSPLGRFAYIGASANF